MNKRQANFLVGAVVAISILIIWYLVVYKIPKADAAAPPSATTVTVTNANGTQQSTVSLATGSTVVVDHSTSTATVTTPNGQTVTADISSISSAYTPEQVAAVVNITNPASGPIAANTVRLFNQSGFQGTAYDVGLDGAELIFSANAQQWDYGSVKMGDFSTLGEGVTLKFSSDDPSNNAVLFLNMTGDITDLVSTVGALPAQNNYTALFSGKSNIYVEVVRYSDAVVESDDLGQQCIQNPPGATFNCLLEFSP